MNNASSNKSPSPASIPQKFPAVFRLCSEIPATLKSVLTQAAQFASKKAYSTGEDSVFFPIIVG
jgi:hypothetical protein